MSENTERLAAKALEMLRRRGVPCVLLRRARGDMTASGDRADQPEPSDAFGVEFPQGLQVEQQEGVDRARGVVLLSAVDPAPEIDDVVVINGHERTVIVPRNMAPDGVLIYSKLEVAL